MTQPAYGHGFWLQLVQRTVCLLLLLCSASSLAVTFTNRCRIVVDDPTAALSLPANNALTVSFWFKLSIPSGYELPGHMTLLMNRQDGEEAGKYAYFFRFNRDTANIEFLCRGEGGRTYQRTLIERPFLDRWYHVAVARLGSQFYAYVDGRPLSPPVEASDVGDTASSHGIAIGDSAGAPGKHLLGEVIEVAIYQSGLDGAVIRDRMFKDQRGFANLKGYFKLDAGAAPYTNSVVVRPPGTETGRSVGPNVPLFEETDRAGEQSLFDSRKDKGAGAIIPLSGAFGWQQTALARPTPGIAFDFRYGYSSALPSLPGADSTSDPYSPRTLGGGWRQSFDVRLIPEQSFSERRLLTWDGSIETWDRIENTDRYQTRHKEYRGELERIQGGDFEWTTAERLVYRFRDPTLDSLMAGRLLEIRDFNGNATRILWNEDEGHVRQVTDTAGGIYRFNFDAAFRRLTNVVFNSWEVNFEYDRSNRLSAKWITNTAPSIAGITAPNVNTRWEFRYGTNGFVSGIVDPRGYTNLAVVYDQYGRQTNQVDALLRTNRTEYGVPGKRQLRRSDPQGFQWLETFDRKGRILAQQDPLTNVVRYTYDDRGNRTSITEPLGWQTSFGYDERANVTARTNALGQVATWRFHARFNKAIEAVTPQPASVNGFPAWTNHYAYDAGGKLTRHFDALGTLVGYRYETNGLVLASTNANGFVTSFAYDPSGFLVSRTEPFTINSTVTTVYVVNDVGWKLRETNPLGDPTRYDLDLNGNPVRVQDVLGRVYQRTYDPIGNLLSTTDGKGQLTTFTYDAANQRISTTDRTRTNVWSTAYTVRGKVDRVTDPLGNVVINTYDEANRLVRVTEPLGGSVNNRYDANGNTVATLDKLGRSWSKTYDRLNRVETEADPLGNTRRTSYDLSGRILQTTTPNGHPTSHTYDGRGRLLVWQDAEGSEWLYTYDGVGNIIDIEDALHGHYVMHYGPRNERILERNQDHFEWRYAYDELLRLQEQRDPNGTTRTPTYDAAGRLLLVDFSTGRRDTYGPPDANDNLPLISRRFGGVTTSTRFVYDALDRPIEQTDALGKTVGYGYDPLGRVSSLTYPGGKTLANHFDALGRLIRQVDWSGREMTYAYDLADRLVRRTWPNGVVQTNRFDEAGRLTDLSHSPITPQPSTVNLALTYAYDHNGNKTGSSEKGTLRWPTPTLTDEVSTFTASGRLQTRTISTPALPNSQPLTWGYSYDAGGNLTNASVTGGPGGSRQSWALTYDEDNRTTSLLWTTNGVTHTVRNRYDALGRRVARTLDGMNTGYVLSLTGGMERILCDVTASGEITAWYVHGPDLGYMVDTANEVLCYHTDAQANVIALSGANGTSFAQYAYTPYGRVLGTTNHPPSTILSSQPYKFVGSQGVMEEFPGLYFMRARYYSAEAGVFLSTDPVKKIGPGWKPVAYAYAGQNPLGYTDPSGEIRLNLTAYPAGFIYGYLKRTIFDVTAGFAVAVNVVILGNSKDVALRETVRAFDFLDDATDELFQESFVGKIIFSDLAVEVGESASRWTQEQAFKNMNTRKGGGGVGSSASGNQSASPQASSPNHSKAFLSAPQSATAPRVDFNSAGSSGNQSLSSRSTGAESYAQAANYSQSQRSAPASNFAGSTGSQGGGTTGGGGGGGAGSSGSGSGNRFAETAQRVVNSIVSNVTNAARNVWNWVTGEKKP